MSEAPERRVTPSRRRLLIGAIVAVGLCLAGVAVSFVVRLLPWIAAPERPVEEIDARWSQVERWAATGPACRAGVEPLLAAGELADRAVRDADGPEARFAVGRADGEPWPSLAREDLSAQGERALASLVEWDRGAHGVILEPDDGRSHMVELLRLARLAMAVREPDGAPAPEMIAALHLGRELRRCGGLVELVLGGMIARDAAEWADEHGAARLLGELAASAPVAREVAPVLARDANDVIALVAREVRAGTPREGWTRYRRGVIGDPSMPWPPLDVVNMERELLVYRAVQGDRVHLAFEHDGDLEGMALAVDRPLEAMLGRSALLQLSALPWAPHVLEYAQIIESHEDRLGALEDRAEAALPGGSI